MNSTEQRLFPEIVTASEIRKTKDEEARLKTDRRIAASQARPLSVVTHMRKNQPWLYAQNKADMEAYEQQEETFFEGVARSIPDPRMWQDLALFAIILAAAYALLNLAFPGAAQ